ncbi:hypothetical protein EJ08DRAFT_26916 [Tothia fuscella]|uniref:DUF7703 domain-containing protein n=1 Tax=Tothia fuscella TaxID=1048955 RepID=A0A9P4NGI2_9PEZI|nr:hypothetical protein EJ08DRAFT_26916 [Tothia fuscella]
MLEEEHCTTFVPLSQYDWGFGDGGQLAWNPIVFSLFASFSALAYWISLELVLLAYCAFKQHKTLYFSAITITALGIILQTTGYILSKLISTSPQLTNLIITEIGWIGNVTGFSLVLYSRLHLVVRDPRILKAVLAMITTNAVVFHTSTAVLEFALVISPLPSTFLPAALIFEPLQQTVFATQESVIAILYIYHTARFLRSGYTSHKTRRGIIALISMQLFVIALDGILTGFFYAGWLVVKCMLHPFFYALKLRLEFVVLNQLKGLCDGGVVVVVDEQSVR